LSPDAETFVTGSCDNDCILWDIKSGEAINCFEGNEDDVNIVKFVFFSLLIAGIQDSCWVFEN